MKNAEAKTHPCCVPYAELPEEQRGKDDVFLATAGDVLAVLKGKIVVWPVVQDPGDGQS